MDPQYHWDSNGNDGNAVPYEWDGAGNSCSPSGGGCKIGYCSAGQPGSLPRPSTSVAYCGGIVIYNGVIQPPPTCVSAP